LKQVKNTDFLRPIYANSGFDVAPCSATSRYSHYPKTTFLPMTFPHNPPKRRIPKRSFPDGNFPRTT
jgi:hypothetical protein